jgi:5-oxoprolinase (ATP-hydrolysing) subunit B
MLAELSDALAVRDLHGALINQLLPGVVGVVPAARTVLIEFDPQLLSAREVSEWVMQTQQQPTTPQRPAGPLVELDVSYDGADLDVIATIIGESRQAVIDRHSNAEYAVQFCGFSPGFAYLTGLDPVLQLPRLATPRPAVPSGSVAIADEFTGVYPRSSPGGWLLLGRTEAVMFDVDREPPALLRPGVRVRFHPT